MESMVLQRLTTKYSSIDYFFRNGLQLRVFNFSDDRSNHERERKKKNFLVAGLLEVVEENEASDGQSNRWVFSKCYGV